MTALLCLSLWSVYSSIPVHSLLYSLSTPTMLSFGFQHSLLLFWLLLCQHSFCATSFFFSMPALCAWLSQQDALVPFERRKAWDCGRTALLQTDSDCLRSVGALSQGPAQPWPPCGFLHHQASSCEWEGCLSLEVTKQLVVLAQQTAAGQLRAQEKNSGRGVQCRHPKDMWANVTFCSVLRITKALQREKPASFKQPIGVSDNDVIHLEHWDVST